MSCLHPNRTKLETRLIYTYQPQLVLVSAAIQLLLIISIFYDSRALKVKEKKCSKSEKESYGDKMLFTSDMNSLLSVFSDVTVKVFW